MSDGSRHYTESRCEPCEGNAGRAVGNLAAAAASTGVAVLFLWWLKPHKRSPRLGRLLVIAKTWYRRLNLRSKIKQVGRSARRPELMSAPHMLTPLN